MARDPRNSRAFAIADELVLETYRATRVLPSDERYGLQSQLRRGAVSISANLVEGCARASGREYLHFVDTALASASEVRYLVSVTTRLGYFDADIGRDLESRFEELVRTLHGLAAGIARALDLSGSDL